MTPKILDWCLSTGKFYYMKYTCCDIEVIRERCNQLSGSKFKLLNANCQTLLESMNNGADDYCGKMCNSHPKLYSFLGNNYDNELEKAELIQSFIGTFGFIESSLPYPLTAKYHINLCGIETELTARNRKKKKEELNLYAKGCMKQMKIASDYLETVI